MQPKYILFGPQLHIYKYTHMHTWANIHTHTLTDTHRRQPHACSLECVCCLSLEAPVGPTRRRALDADLSYLISLTQYWGTIYLDHHNPSCRDHKIMSHRKRSNHIVFAISSTVHLHVTVSGRGLIFLSISATFIEFAQPINIPGIPKLKYQLLLLC